jgi:hypothetical protein
LNYLIKKKQRQRRSLYSDAETAVGANAYHSEKTPELAHQEDLRDRNQIHSRVLLLSQSPQGMIPVRCWE